MLKTGLSGENWLVLHAPEPHGKDNVFIIFFIIIITD